jgi:uncharacterized protein
MTIGSIGPTRPHERVLEIDILRGIAVFGMIIWNFRSNSMGFYRTKEGIDCAVCGIVSILGFKYTVHLLFSFLFGWGLALQMIRAQAGGISFTLIYLRRLLSLFVIGVVNCFLFYRSEILHIYALLGIILLFLVNRSNRTILILAVLSIGLPVLGWVMLGRSISPDSYYGSNTYNSYMAQFIMSSNYIDMVLARAHEFLTEYAHPHAYIGDLDILGASLLGLYAARRGVFQDISGNICFIRKVLWGLLAIGLIGLGFVFALGQLKIVGGNEPDWLLPIYGLLRRESLKTLAKLYSMHVFSLLYICLIVLLLQGKSRRKLFRPVAKLGQMAISNYLLHIVIGTTIFYRYGLGLYGNLGCALGEALAIIVFILQMVVSIWWLKKYQFGPIEWLWRSLTYWRLQPMYVKIA